MDVVIIEFRAGRRGWVDRVERGEDVVLTERGVPVARLVPVDSSGLLARLESALALDVGKPVLAAWDRRLWAAARSAGLRVAPAQL